MMINKIVFGFLVMLIINSCKDNQELSAMERILGKSDVFLEDWGNASKGNTDTHVNDYIMIDDRFEKHDIDADAGVIRLVWDGGRVAMASGDDFTGYPMFEGRSLDNIIKDLSHDDPDTDSDKVMRIMFLWESNAGLISGENDLFIIRYKIGEKDIDAILINRENNRYVFAVGGLDAEPDDWKDVARFLYEGIEVK